jgi:hypothetical protein
MRALERRRCPAQVRCAQGGRDPSEARPAISNVPSNRRSLRPVPSRSESDESGVLPSRSQRGGATGTESTDASVVRLTGKFHVHSAYIVQWLVLVA